MSDTISRKGVFIPDITVEMFRNASLESIEDLMASGEMEDILLPSVTPKQKRGKWINGYCSECGKHAPFWAMASTYYKSSFCPNCGADMRGEQDG